MNEFTPWPQDEENEEVERDVIDEDDEFDEENDLDDDEPFDEDDFVHPEDSDRAQARWEEGRGL